MKHYFQIMQPNQEWEQVEKRELDISSESAPEFALNLSALFNAEVRMTTEYSDNGRYFYYINPNLISVDK